MYSSWTEASSGTLRASFRNSHCLRPRGVSGLEGAGGRVHVAAASVVLGYLALAVAWSFVVPLGGGIDEPHSNSLKVAIG